MLNSNKFLVVRSSLFNVNTTAKTIHEVITLVRANQLQRIEFRGSINATKEEYYQLIEEAKGYGKINTLIIDNVQFVYLDKSNGKTRIFSTSNVLNNLLSALDVRILAEIELKHMDLGHAESRKHFQNILNKIMSETKVRHLRIEDIVLTAFEARSIASTLPKIDHIKSLELYDNSLTEEASSIIIKSLENNKSLLKAFIHPGKNEKKYYFSKKKNKIPGNGLKFISKIIERNKQIKSQREKKRIESAKTAHKNNAKQIIFPPQNPYANKASDIEHDKYYLFYDLETTGKNHCFDQIIQFSAVITDDRLNMVKFIGTPNGKINFYIQLNPDTLPTVGAMLTHSIPLDNLQQSINPCEYEAMCFIHKLVNDRSISKVIGYNSSQFDDKFLQHGFYRNLLSPYDQKQHIDVYSITAVYAALYPKPSEVVKSRSKKLTAWPYAFDQYELKLDSINQTNQLFQAQAHDALNDVYITIALARELQSMDTKFWNYLRKYQFNKSFDLVRLKEVKTDLNGESVCLILKNNSIHYAHFVCENKHIRRSYWLLLDVKDFTHAGSSSTLIEMKIDVRKKAGNHNLLFVKHYEADTDYFMQFDKKMPIRQRILHEKNLLWLQKNIALFNAIKSYYSQYRYSTRKYVDSDAELFLTDLYSLSLLCNAVPKKQLLDQKTMLDWDVDTVQAFIRGHFHVNPMLDKLIERIICRNSRLFQPNIYSAWVKEFSDIDAPNSIKHLRDYQRGVFDYKGEEHLKPTGALQNIIFCKLVLLMLIDKKAFKTRVNLNSKQKAAFKNAKGMIKAKLPAVFDRDTIKVTLINYYALLKELQKYIMEKFEPHRKMLSYSLKELDDFCDKQLLGEDLIKSLARMSIKDSNEKRDILLSHNIVRLLKEDFKFKPYPNGHRRRHSTGNVMFFSRSNVEAPSDKGKDILGKGVSIAKPVNEVNMREGFTANRDSTSTSSHGLTNEARVKELLNAHRLSTLYLGKAADDGDCFFDALAQYVNIIKDTDINSTKYLRALCHGFYSANKANKALVDAWNASEYGGEFSAPDEYYMIQYTAQECRDNFHGRPPIWGRPAIEGIILCRQLGLESILVMEVLENPEIKKLILSYHLVTQEKYKSITEEDAQTYSDNPRIPILINSQSSLHFIPLMRNAISNPKVSMTQFDEHSPRDPLSLEERLHNFTAQTKAIIDTYANVFTMKHSDENQVIIASPFPCDAFLTIEPLQATLKEFQGYLNSALGSGVSYEINHNTLIISAVTNKKADAIEHFLKAADCWFENDVMEEANISLAS